MRLGELHREIAVGRKVKAKKRKDKTRSIHKCTFYKRTFLNKGKKGIAFCEAQFDREGYINETQKHISVHSNGSISISDCNRIITLSFDFYNTKEAKNSLHKIQILTSILAQFQTQMKNEMEEIKKLKKLYPNKREKHQ